MVNCWCYETPPGHKGGNKKDFLLLLVFLSLFQFTGKSQRKRITDKGYFGECETVFNVSLLVRAEKIDNKIKIKRFQIVT